MSNLKIPNGHQAVMPYLMLEKASRFAEFTQKVLGGQIVSTHYQEEEPEMIKHSEVLINGSAIMFCDARAEWPAHPANMFVYVENADDTYKLALEAGGISIMEPADQDYGRSCGVQDPCGNVWWATSVL